MSGHYEPAPDLAVSRERAATLDVTAKRWTAETLKALGVGQDVSRRFVFEIVNAAGEPVGVVRYADDGRTPKVRADPRSTRDLWPAPEHVDGEVLYVVEGEPDAVSMHELGLSAVAIPGVGKDQADWPTRLARGRTRVVFLPDADDVGRTRMNALAARVAEHTQAVVLDMGYGRSDGFDVGDMLRDRGPETTREEIAAAMDFGAPVEPPKKGDGPRIRERVVSDIPTRATGWLFKPYVPLGKLTILAGAAGQGKSQLALWLAAQVTRGETAFDLTEPRDVLVLTGEDDPEDTIRPRLQALNADLSRVIVVDVIRQFGQLETADLLMFPTDQGLLRDVLVRRRVGLVIVDPISAFMDPTLSTYRNVDVRRALGPLKGMAEEFGHADIVISHFNKASEGDVLARVTDSGAYVQMARSVLMFGPDPDDDEGDRGSSKVLVVAKSNLAPPGDWPLRFELRADAVQDNAGNIVGTSRVHVMGTATGTTAEDLFMGLDDRDELARAKQWVRSKMATRWLPREDIDSAARAANIKPRTLRRALKAEGRKAKEAGVAHGRWFWTAKTNRELPPWDAKTASDTTPKLGHVGHLDDQDGQGGQFSDRPPGPSWNGRPSDDTQDGQDDSGDNVRYLRERDRRLGETWDDDE